MSYAADRAEIEDLMARYLFAMDYHDADAYAECFTEDGELDWAMGVAKGREAIRAEAVSFKARIGEIFKDSAGNPANLRHVVAEMTNGGPGGSVALPSFGIYEDELKRIDGRWLFTRRKICNEFLPGRESGAANPVRASRMV